MTTIIIYIKSSDLQVVTKKQQKGGFKMIKRKKMLSTIFAVAMLATMGTSALASTESLSPYQLPYDIETGVQFVDQTSATVVGETRAILGNGTLYTSNGGLFGKPDGYAYTKADQKSYEVRAKCDVNNNGESTGSSGWKTQENTTASNSDTVDAKTDKCTFTGFFEIQVTSSSAVGKAETSKSYS